MDSCALVGEGRISSLKAFSLKFFPHPQENMTFSHLFLAESQGAMGFEVIHQNILFDVYT